jgi:hypothetical protein
VLGFGVDIFLFFSFVFVFCGFGLAICMICTFRHWCYHISFHFSSYHLLMGLALLTHVIIRFTKRETFSHNTYTLQRLKVF